MIKKNINDIVASSLDNEVIFFNDKATKNNYVVFGFVSGMAIKYGQTTYLIIEDENDPNAFSIRLTGSDGAKATSSTFSTSTSKENVLLSLADCLRKNSNIFSNVFYNGSVVLADLPNGRKYKIRTENMMGLSMSITQYEPHDISKYMIQYRGTDGVSFISEKYNDGQETVFNVTAPFECMNLKYPIRYYIDAFTMVNGEYKSEFINQYLTIMPTTLKKLDEIDYDDYIFNEERGNYKRLLTNNVKRTYRNGERASFSFISNEADYEIKALLYTNGGKYLNTIDLDYEAETHSIREDITFMMDMDALDLQYFNGVGEFRIRVMSGDGVQMFEDLIYKYTPVCKPNNELFFLNRIGGIDSCNFIYGWESKSKISNAVDYISTSKGDIKEIESRKMLKNNVTYTLSANVNKATAEWLREMAESKWVYYMATDGTKYTVIIDDLNVNTNDKDTNYTVSVNYHRSDDLLFI